MTPAVPRHTKPTNSLVERRHFHSKLKLEERVSPVHGSMATSPDLLLSFAL
ncbi:hypothetical protein POX_b02113 [Penicillium oxalicum]|uniref:hypothetical protein n=1 Tax=Penicillium oxalicum TaxID=69781 RepID=UPI0020B842B1|nr:hypothetical protein POX_b02113 [Penicillium oxalicum]KAI2792079.1 hypothetical protein POX_b02113 [Penicillium oxalicum]